MSTEIIRAEDLKIDLTRWHGMSIQAERQAQSIEVTCDEEEQMAVDALSEIKSFQKQTESARKDNVTPFNNLVSRVNDMFRPIGDSLTNAESIIKNKVKHYRMEKERIRQEEERKNQEEFQKRIAEEKKKAEETGKEQRILAPPPTTLPVASTTHGSFGRATGKKFWNFEVENIEELYKARPDLIELVVRKRETKEAVQRNQSIPGLRIFEDMEISAR